MSKLEEIIKPKKLHPMPYYTERILSHLEGTAECSMRTGKLEIKWQEKKLHNEAGDLQNHKGPGKVPFSLCSFHFSIYNQFKATMM